MGVKRGTLERFHGHGPTFGLGMGLSDASHDRVHICLSLANADARFETSDHVHRRAPIPHARAKHTHYDVRLAIHMQDSTYNRRIAAETLPHSMGKDYHV